MVRPLTEGMVRKGGRNQGPSQITVRPPPPASMIAATSDEKRAVFALPRATAPADTDPLWLQTYAFCRGMNRVACSCENAVVVPCSHLLLGLIEVEKFKESMPG